MKTSELVIIIFAKVSSLKTFCAEEFREFINSFRFLKDLNINTIISGAVKIFFQQNSVDEMIEMISSLPSEEKEHAFEELLQICVGFGWAGASLKVATILCRNLNPVEIIKIIEEQMKVECYDLARKTSGLLSDEFCFFTLLEITRVEAKGGEVEEVEKINSSKTFIELQTDESPVLIKEEEGIKLTATFKTKDGKIVEFTNLPVELIQEASILASWVETRKIGIFENLLNEKFGGLGNFKYTIKKLPPMGGFDHYGLTRTEI